MVSITEANQNFSRVARLVDEKKSVVVMKNNRLAYVVLEFDAYEQGRAESQRFGRALNKVITADAEVTLGAAVLFPRFSRPGSPTDDAPAGTRDLFSQVEGQWIWAVAEGYHLFEL